MPDTPLIKSFLGYQSDFMAYLMAITRDIQASEEIFQNAAIVVMEAQFKDVQIRDIRAWAKEVIRRQALAYLQTEHRKQSRVRALQPELLEQIDHIFVAESQSTEHAQQERSALEGCIASMDETSRKMLAMRYEGKASFDEIAQKIEKSAGAVQKALSRIRQQLRTCVQTKLAGSL